jgi:hypothetical protein
MVTFEALRPLQLKTRSEGVISIASGQQLTWPDEAVQFLLERAPEKIRVVEEKPRLPPAPGLNFSPHCLAGVPPEFMR